ncbi:hypothetical protein HanRHA438_Chr15g0715601 [Helianthus annuus]|nr:hypothetical protein HanRHA438_Chr15g0715601 [Helianthus annuus]
MTRSKRPATLSPTPRPLGLDRKTLIPPDLFLIPRLSDGINDPTNESISKRPLRTKKGVKISRKTSHLIAQGPCCENDITFIVTS